MPSVRVSGPKVYYLLATEEDTVMMTEHRLSCLEIDTFANEEASVDGALVRHSR